MCCPGGIAGVQFKLYLHIIINGRQILKKIAR